MRVRHLSVLPLVLLLAGATSAAADPLKPDEARRFVAGKLFSYSCFEGTQGLGRIFPDGSVIGTFQPRGKAPRFVALPAGTIRVGSSSICASVKGLLFQPCFDVNQTSQHSFRGSISGLSFAYCDFVRHNARTRLTRAGSAVTGSTTPRQQQQQQQPLNLRPSQISAPAAPAPVQSAVIRTEN